MTFRPWVKRLGEHLRADGTVCTCVRGETDYQQPKQPPTWQEIKRIPTWADHELADAQKRGVNTYIASRDWGK